MFLTTVASNLLVDKISKSVVMYLDIKFFLF